MRLLFFISELGGGGAERVMTVLCNKLSERGHDVYLVFDTSRPVAYELSEKVQKINLSPWRTCKGINLLARLVNIRRVTRKIKPDVIISFIRGLNAEVLLSTFGLRIPVVASEHSTFDANFPARQRFSMYYMNRLATRVTVLTRHDRDFIGDRLKNTVVMPNPLPYPVYTGNNERKKNVLCAGSIDRCRPKGFDNIIKIWGEISGRFPGWTLDICGGGRKENFEYLKQLTLEHGVHDTVNFTGFRNDIDKLMQETSIFCLPSKSEGFSMVLIEAMSRGCACVCFDCKSGPGEIVTRDKSGILVKDQDMEEMGEALIKVMSDEKLREQLSIAAREEVKRFDVDVITDRWENLFNEIKTT
jgi:glycosyltransferase involved in cell wall biosynthesis